MNSAYSQGDVHSRVLRYTTVLDTHLYRTRFGGAALVSTLLSSVGRWSYRHPWRVLGSWILLLLVMGAAALGLNKGFDNSITIPGTEAQNGIEQLERTFPQVAGTAAQFIVVAADGDSVEDAGYREPIEAAVDDLEGFEEMSSATSPYGDLVDGLVTDD